MHIELTEQQRARAQQGEPVDVVDPQTSDAYVLIARAQFDRVRSEFAAETPAGDEAQIPEGIRISQEAFRRALPGLLAQERLERHWVAYHRNEQLSIARTGEAVLDACIKRGLADTEYYLGWIHPSGLQVEEDVEPRLHHYVEDPNENP